ncbi:MAG: hypothetical protein LBK66_11570 [Spirochaetaceae bacterium]|jgi:hypothetical protein|nr:hypothetical protein [Spirochaetaceae bacterium]
MNREQFEQKRRSGEIKWEHCPENEAVVNPHDIIEDKEWNANDPKFWNHHGRTKEEYMDFVQSGRADEAAPPEVSRCSDQYVLEKDGNHRIAASKELNRPIKVNVTGKYIENKQSQDADNSRANEKPGNEPDESEEIEQEM